MTWHYPTFKDDGWYPSKDNAWPVGGAYHILQMKETPNRYDIGSSVMHGDYIKFTEHDGCIYGSLKVVRQV